ncbi:unnamed protein product [Caenorhabditis auriculariae]|uniref:Protein kinase domain-containing protein n=1 Tax=Caenorhabditis auriculariae TaxID=2777116 RepID=A0A8S1GW24_9PELO|nr:unnamed protein product [Caenorhabditis auriculariae]
MKLFLAIFLVVLIEKGSSECSCKTNASECVVSSKMSLKGRIQAIKDVNSTELLETVIVVYVVGLENVNGQKYDLLQNESSLTIDWLPMNHDVIEPSRAPPKLKSVQMVDVGNSTLAIVVELLFDVLNMKLRSTYEIRINSVYDKECGRMVPLTSKASLNVTFACERILNADCKNAVKIDHHPVCNLMRNYHTKVVETGDLREVDVLVSVERQRQKKIKYFAVHYGQCEHEDEVEQGCILDLQKSQTSRFCVTNKSNCPHDRSYNVTISPFIEGRYGIQVCGVIDKRFEYPPIVGGVSKIVADQLYLSSTAMSMSVVASSADSLTRTLFGYAVVIAMLILILLLLLIYKCAMGKIVCCRRQKKSDIFTMDETSVILFEDKVLGKGRFGTVYLGQLSSDWHGPVILDELQRVAVKSSRNVDKQQRQVFFDEMEGAKYVGRHSRFIAFIGTIPTQKGLLHVMEYCSNGNLLDYLTCRRNYMLQLQQRGINLNGSLTDLEDVEFDDVVSTQDLHRIASQICCGMMYLSSKGIVHNALSGRHVLITSDHSAKIADFGFISTPNTKTNWSYGVVLWELFTLGGSPYCKIPDEGIRSLIEKGYRLQKPENCLLTIYQLMRECWYDSPTERPTFSLIAARLSQLVTSEPPEAFKFLSISTSCDYYSDEPIRRESVADAVAADSTELISESARLLGFRR